MSLCGEGSGFIATSCGSGKKDHLTGPKPTPVSGTTHRCKYSHITHTPLLTYGMCPQDVELDYECVLVIEGHTVVVDAFVESDDMNPSSFDITCQLHKV